MVLVHELAQPEGYQLARIQGRPGGPRAPTLRSALTARRLVATPPFRVPENKPQQTAMLERGDVERIEVANKALVRVYLRHDSEMAAKSPAGPGMAQYQFQIGSVDSFEHSLEEAQKVHSSAPSAAIAASAPWIVCQTEPESGGGGRDRLGPALPPAPEPRRVPGQLRACPLPLR